MSETSNGTTHNENGDKVITLSGMYENYFLDYASYVILERAVPHINDGLKPVQRRILHALRQMDDGRYHKVANVIGQTMQYHPHGDAAIGDALVNLGQKDLLIDPQGNWGDTRTGDRAAAARYIEARLTKFALEVAFNPQTTEWQLSYDGRKKEPVTLPMKFPLLLKQGVEGIAVGLSTKILPHNFVELIKASIKILEGKRVKIYPDFGVENMIDVSDYQGGKRGGKVRVRAKLEVKDKSTILVKALPYGMTTGTLIDSIVKANDKGKIKIKKVTDNTAADVEVEIQLAPGVSAEVTMDALYAFTNCEQSISPNACVIIDDKPHFITVEEILKTSTEGTRELLRIELEIKKAELQEKWHFASLEKIFIKNRVYREIEECESWEEVLKTIDVELKKYFATPSDKAKKGDKRIQLMRDITEEDIVRLTEIKIKRISKYNSFKADELIAQIEEDLKQVQHNLDHLTEFAIDYFENLLKKYGKGRERKTIITEFDNIKAVAVVANNAKLYVNYKEGFVGTGLKKDEFVSDCSDIDDIIAFKKDGTFQVTRISDKTFVGKNIIHCAVWKKGDERTTYNLLYVDGKTAKTYAKRFNVSAITRDKNYNLTKSDKNSKVLYFTANPNAESEVVGVYLSPNARARIKEFDYDFAELAIKGRSAGGNQITKYPVRKVVQKSVGESTLGALKIWMDETSGRLNTEERGKLLGAFDTGDMILAVYNNGTYEMTDYEMTNRYETQKLVWIGKFKKDQPISALHYYGEKDWTMVKRFVIETSKLGEKFSFINDSKGSTLLYATAESGIELECKYGPKKSAKVSNIKLDEFMDLKGWKALGNKFVDSKVWKVTVVGGDDNQPPSDDEPNNPPPPPEEVVEAKEKTTKPKADKKPTAKKDKPAPKAKKESKAAKPKKKATKPAKKSKPKGKLKPGDSIDFEVDDGQGKLF